MATRSFRLAWPPVALIVMPALAVVSLVLTPVSLAASSPSAKEEIRFGVEAASQGLWREALFRWERALKNYPDNARLRNNLAVAYESMGQIDQAEAQYKEAIRFDPTNKDIQDNYASFQQIVKQIRQRQSVAAGVTSPSPAPGGAASPTPGAASAAGETAPAPAPPAGQAVPTPTPSEP